MNYSIDLDLDYNAYYNVCMDIVSPMRQKPPILLQAESKSQISVAIKGDSFVALPQAYKMI